MAVPKRRMSRSNTRSRRSQWKAAPVAIATCGTYNDRQVLEVG